jgi:hypothetical protein
MVLWNKEDHCHLKTVPNRLVVCREDELIWETSFIPQCNQYKGDLNIEVKESSPGQNFEARPGQAEARGGFPGWPSDCPESPPCFVEYTVTLQGPSDTLTEDPNIDIWR